MQKISTSFSIKHWPLFWQILRPDGQFNMKLGVVVLAIVVVVIEVVVVVVVVIVEIAQLGPSSKINLFKNKFKKKFLRCTSISISD